MNEKQRYISAQADIEPVQAGPVHVRFVEAKGDHGLLELWLDYAKADTPTRAYFADYVDVLEGRADITLIFGRLIPRTEELRSQVEISFPRDSFVGQLYRSTRDMHAGLKQNERRLVPAGEVALTSNAHTSRSNNVFIAIMGEEAICDFYYIAPSDLQFLKMKRRQTVPLEPIVRISLATPLLLEFLDKCEALVAKMPEMESILKRGEDASK